MNGIYNPDVVVYHLGDSSTAIATHDFGFTSQTVEDDGLAFSPDGTRVFAITGDNGFQAPKDTFHVLTLPGGSAPDPSTSSTSTSTSTTSPSTSTTSTSSPPVTIPPTRSATLTP